MTFQLPKIGGAKFSREDYQSDNAYVAAILNEHGLTKQTGINEAAGEATYVDYAGALSDDLLNAILNGGYGETDGWDEKELAIRENIANIYRQQGRSVLQTRDLIAMIQSMGYKVSSTYTQTSYIIDNKNDGHYDKDVYTGGAINVLTITDAEGNDIVIADANGNAAIEVEELFIDEIISGAVSTIENMEYAEYSSISQRSSDAIREMSAFDVDFAIDNIDSSDIWLEYQLSKLEKEEEKEQLRKEQNARIADAKKELAKEAEIEKQEAKAMLEAKLEAEKTYNKEMTKFKEDYIEELKNNEEYADYSDKELEELALEEAVQYCKKKLGYELDEIYEAK